GAVVARDHHEERTLRLADTLELALEHVDVDIRGGQHHVAERVGYLAVVGDGDLAQGFHGDPVAHRMRDDVDAFRAAGPQQAQRLFEAVAGYRGRVVVVDVVDRAPGRCPGEQH